jgi:xanthine dehydrogenase small subunit
MGQLFNSPLMSAELALCRDQPVQIESGENIFHKPVTIADAVQFKTTHPDCIIVSGGTDLAVQVNKGGRKLKSVLSTTALSELREVHVSENEIVVGANVSIAELGNTLAGPIPEFASMIERFGSPQIKNVATLGGNIANGSPIGDTMPALFVLNAQVELRGARGVRQANINNFYSGYRQTIATTDELISRIVIPCLGSGEKLKLFKVSKRQDLDISTFSAAFWLKIARGTIENIRIAYGGVAPTIIRLTKTEAHLRGAELSADAFESAGEIALSEISSISDVRGSAEYRNLLAANILQKLYYDLDAEQKHTSVT